jgi:hypothetical protein
MQKSDWRDMADAPRDGTVVEVCYAGWFGLRTAKARPKVWGAWYRVRDNALVRPAGWRPVHENTIVRTMRCDAAGASPTAG